MDEDKIGDVTRTLRKNRPIIMKRSRKFERPRSTNEGKISEVGSLIVIAYKGSKRDRMKIDVFLRRAPCIRLCRGVYAFSQWHKRFDKGEELVDATKFWNFIREVDENAVVISRLIIDNSESIAKILEETRTRVEKKIEGIIEGNRNLYQKMRQGEGDREYVLSTARKLRKKFVTVKKLSNFYVRWLRLNLSHLLIRPYSSFRKVNSLLGEKYGVVLLRGK